MSDRLLLGLIEYRDAVTRHIQQLDQEFEVLSREWMRFNAIYEGDAAHEFKNLWLRTTANFQEYTDRSRRILAVLEERITFLQEADRSSS